MRAKPEFQRRDETQTAVLDALVDRGETGMTVFELRARVDVEIDDLETALGELKDDDLIRADSRDSRTVIRADERVVPDEEPEPDTSLLDELRRRLGL